MRRDARLTAPVFAIVLAVAGLSVFAQSVEQPPVGLEPSGDVASALLDGPEASLGESLARRIESRWMRREAMLDAGDRTNASFIAREVLELARVERVRRLPLLAGAAYAEGLEEEAAGNATNAIEAFRLARELDPHLAEASWAEARIRWRGGGETKEVLALVAEALRQRWLPSWALLADTVATLQFMLVASIVAGIALIVTLACRHGKRVAASVGSLVSPRWHAAWQVAAGLAFLLGPLALGVLGIWVVLYWAVVLAPALSVAERRFVVAWLILLAFVVPATRGLALLQEAPQREDVAIATLAAERTLSPSLITDLARLATERPREAMWRVLLAEMCAEHHPERAVLLLRDAARLEPRDPRIHIALGNVFFRLGKHETAGVHYRDALDVSPGNVPALINLAKVRLAAFDFKMAESLADQARTSDASAFARIQASLAEGEVANPEVTRDEVVRHVLRSIVVPDVVGQLSWTNSLAVAALATLLGLALARLRVPQLSRETCEMCGTVFDAGMSALPEATCTACFQVLSRKQDLAPAARGEQLKRIERRLGWTTRLRALVQLVWPGLAVIHEGRTTLGMIQVWAWSLLVAAAFFADFPLPGRIIGQSWAPGLAAFALAAPLWLLLQFPGFRPRAIGARRGA